MQGDQRHGSFMGKGKGDPFVLTWGRAKQVFSLSGCETRICRAPVLRAFLSTLRPLTSRLRLTVVGDGVFTKH